MPFTVVTNDNFSAAFPNRTGIRNVDCARASRAGIIVILDSKFGSDGTQPAAVSNVDRTGTADLIERTTDFRLFVGDHRRCGSHSVRARDVQRANGRRVVSDKQVGGKVLGRI